jgi:hypothetical protein
MKLSLSILLIGLTGVLGALGEEVVPPEEQPVSGSCVVSLIANVYNREKCDLSAAAATVPNGFRLKIQHVSAACSTPPSRGIFTLALIARLSPDGPARTTHLPVTLQAAAPDQLRLVGAQNVTIYAGSGTSVEVLVSTWEGAPSGHTGCEVSFTAVLQRVSQ